MKVVDEKGNEYPSLGKAMAAYGLVTGGSTYTTFKRKGVYNAGGHTFTLVEGEVAKEPTPLLNRGGTGDILNRIGERYTPEELEALAQGRGLLDKRLQYDVPKLHGTHYRIGVLSDTHIGSVYSPTEWIETTLKEFKEQGCDFIVHAGDIVEGMKVKRLGTQIFELSEIGYRAQRDKAIDIFSKTDIPIFIIAGNHDMFFAENTGMNIVEDIASQVPHMTYLGYDQADIDLDGCTIRLFHGGDGSSYALSYRLQKIAESIAADSKPGLMICGHTHKMVYIYDHDIHMVSAPSIQRQTDYMRGKKLAAHTGFLILDVEIDNARICNLTFNYYPL